MTLLRLYQRCDQRKCLPCEGGVLDQPLWIMSAFDVIDERKAQIKQKQTEAAEMNEARRKLKVGYASS